MTLPNTKHLTFYYRLTARKVVFLLVFGVLLCSELQGQHFEKLTKLRGDELLDSVRYDYEKRLCFLRPEKALGELEKYIVWARANQNVPLLVQTQRFKADYWRIQKDFDKAIEVLLGALKEVRSLQKPQYVCEEIGLLQILGRYHKWAPLRNDKLTIYYYLEAEKLLRANGVETCLIDLFLLSEIGEYYFEFEEYEKALVYFRESRRYIEPRKGAEWIKINYFNTYGLLLQKLNKHEESIEMFNVVRRLAKESNKDVWVGLASGNIAQSYLAQGRYELAKPLFEMELEKTSSIKDFCVPCFTHLGLAECALANGEPKAALYHIAMADTLMLKCPKKERYERVNRMYSNYYNVIGDYKRAYHYQNLEKRVNDSIHKYRASSNIRALALNFEKEKADMESQLMLADKEKGILFRNFGLLLAFCVSVMGIFYFISKRKADALKLENARMENEILETELSHAKSKLDSFAKNIAEKSNLLGKLREEQSMTVKEEPGKLPDAPAEEQGLELAINHLEENTILSEKDWEEFSALFQKAYPGFIQGLGTAYPQLRANDFRLLVLVKLGFNSRKTADVLGVSIDAVRKSKYRLRKKLGLPEEDDFSDLLNG